jgi:hypothetical protein
MNKPNDVVLRLYKIGTIHGLHIEQRQTGADTADTFVEITGSNGKESGLWKTYKQHLDLTPGYNSVCCLRRSDAEHVEAWKRFERENAAELAEYKRLRAKFGDGDV